MRTVILAFLLSFAAMPALAAQEEPQRIDDVQAYVEHQHKLRSKIERGKEFAHMDEQSKRKALKAQDRIFLLLDERDSIDELTQEQMVQLYNAQNVVNGFVADAELERQICRREKHVGSHRVKLVCLSAREWRQVYDATQRDLRAPRTCSPMPGGSTASSGVDPCNQGGG